MISNYRKGAILVILTAVFWGASGVFGQYLFQVANIPPVYATTVRLIVSGFIFLIITLLQGEKEKLLSVMKSKNDGIYTFVYGIIGIMNVQFTYFLAINYSNAATATILQYVSPAMVMLYLAVRTKKLPQKYDVYAIILALIGIFLISTQGNINSLSISPLALFWGLISAVALTINTIMPVRLIKKYSSPIMMAWSMLIGGCVLGLFGRVWTIDVDINLAVIGAFAGVILIGTVAAFYCFFEGVKLIGAGKASLYASVEPLAATLFTVFALGTKFILIDYIGLFCITIMLILLSLNGKNSEQC